MMFNAFLSEFELNLIEINIDKTNMYYKVNFEMKWKLFSFLVFGMSWYEFEKSKPSRFNSRFYFYYYFLDEDAWIAVNFLFFFISVSENHFSGS